MINFLDLIIFIIPAYLANSAPVIVGGGTPMDLGKKFSDKRRILGDGKTIRGFIGGVAAGVIISALITNFFPLEIFGSAKMQFLSGVLLSLGTLVGDAVGSFVKRRMNINPGKPFLLDQLSFLIVALLFSFPFSPKEFFGIVPLLFLFIITYLSHVGSNYAANRLGLKKVPW